MLILSKIRRIFFYSKSFGSKGLQSGGQDTLSRRGIIIVQVCRNTHLTLTGGGADIARKTNYKTGRLILKKFAV
jgi:hypothetical protein